MIEALETIMYPSFFEGLFESGNGVTRRLIPARKDPSNPVLTPETAWEGRFVGYPSVIREPESGEWRMWYTTQCEDEYGVCYAESVDGIEWTRPELGLVEVAGSRANNYVYRPPTDNLMHSHCVIRDPADTPDALYKMVVSLEGPRASSARQTGHMALLVSPDGFRWTVRIDPMLPIMNDSQSTILRSPDGSELLAFHRPSFVVRTISRSHSPDNGLRWDGCDHVLVSNEFELRHKIDHYALSVSPYGPHLMGFSKVYWNNWYDKRCWVELMMSRSSGHEKLGVSWERSTVHTPIIELGDTDEWDAFMMSPGHGLVEDGDGHWLYYDSWNCLHSAGACGDSASRCCIGRAYIPKNRFFEWYSAQDDGYLRTIPFVTTGDTLTIDYDAGPGEIRAELVLPDGSVPDGFSVHDSTALRGTSTAGELTFRGGSLAIFVGRAIRLSFRLPRGARLYAWGVLAGTPPG